MSDRKWRKGWIAAVGGLFAALALAATALAVPGGGGVIDPGTEFYVPKADHGAVAQIADLTSSGDKADAALVRAMVETPQAVWFTGGTPGSVEQDVRATVKRAVGKKVVPVLVAYNVPGRDCAQYSAGGAISGDAYRAWVDGFTAGLGSEKAVVILEPDGLRCCRPTAGSPIRTTASR